jgi:probable Rubsico expression protein CbbX
LCHVGVKMKYVWAGLLPLAVAIGLILGWHYLGSVALIVVVATVLLIGTAVVAGRDAWHQTGQADAAAARYGAQSFEADPGLRRELGPMIPRLGTRASRRARVTPVTPVGVFSRSPLTPGPRAGPASGARPQAARASPASSPARDGRRARAARARRGSEMLRPDGSVTLAEERRAAGIDDILAALDRELVGLIPVKKQVTEIGSLLLIDRARQQFGLSAARPNLHMCFTGPPGTGKTTVALKMAELLHQLGYLERGQVVHAMRDDLVGEYIGHTAPKTKQVLDRAMGGVLFIDEAYTLFRATDSKDYGQECIDILLQVMENDRDKLVVILAGYKDRMDAFFDSNPGMSSRVAHHLDFAEYDLDELLAIGGRMLEQSSYYLSDAATAAFRDWVSLRMRQPRFANARSVRNELERARLRHAYRLAADPERSRNKDDLMRIEAEDILLSPVFSVPQGDPG